MADYKLPFTAEEIKNRINKVSILENNIESYVLNINYKEIGFDTEDIIINNDNTSPVLGKAILGQMVLA